MFPYLCIVHMGVRFVFVSAECIKFVCECMFLCVYLFHVLYVLRPFVYLCFFLMSCNISQKITI